MSDLREVFEMVTKQVDPDRDSWRKQEERQRRRARTRKWSAIAVAAAIAAAVVVFALTTPGDDGGQPVEQPTGSSGPVAQTTGAMIVGLDGTVEAAIPGLPDDASGLRMSPDGRSIAFMTDDRVAVIQRDGSGFRTITDAMGNSGGDAQQAVTWSPDGSRIAYAAHDVIWVVGADGSNEHPLATDPGSFFPAWSSTNVIAYWHGSTTGEDGGPADSEIWTIDANGGQATRLTHDDVSSIEPTWSPDGSRIAFWEGGELWTMGADGTDAHRIYRNPADPGGVWAPAWSPDGTRIAFLSCCADHRSEADVPLLAVRVLDLETGDVTRLDARVETDLNGPTWTQEGALLINRYD